MPWPIQLIRLASYHPNGEEDLYEEYNGLNPNGEWTLFMADLELGGEHQLESWGLEITGETGITAVPEPSASVLASAVCPAFLRRFDPTLHKIPTVQKILYCGPPLARFRLCLRGEYRYDPPVIVFCIFLKTSWLAHRNNFGANSFKHSRHTIQV